MKHVCEFYLQGEASFDTEETDDMVINADIGDREDIMQSERAVEAIKAAMNGVIRTITKRKDMQIVDINFCEFTRVVCDLTDDEIEELCAEHDEETASRKNAEIMSASPKGEPKPIRRIPLEVPKK